MGTLKNNELLMKSSIEFPCSYIKGNLEKRMFVSLDIKRQGDGLISELTKRGFRRNYNHMYIPICAKCNSCVSSRVNIHKFVFSKSNKRNLKINNDLVLQINKTYTKNRFRLFKEYCEIRHPRGQMKKMSEKEFLNFFHNSINQTEVLDLIGKDKKLYGSILLDVLDDGYSAVYSFFDPKLQRRGLGKNIILKVIEKLKKDLKEYLYLGYWVRESDNMSYKSSFNSVEFFKNGNWKEKS